MKKGNAGKGRPKGTPNKITKDLKAMILGALDACGGQKSLEGQAVENPAAFMTLLGKVLPKEIDAKLESNGETVIRIIRETYE